MLADGASAPGALSSPLVDEEPMVDLSDPVFPQWLTSGVLEGVREPISDIAAEIGTSQSLRSAEVTEGVLLSEVGGDDVAESDARGVVSHSEMSRAPDVSQPTFVQEQKRILPSSVQLKLQRLLERVMKWQQVTLCEGGFCLGNGGQPVDLLLRTGPVMNRLCYLSLTVEKCSTWHMARYSRVIWVLKRP